MFIVEDGLSEIIIRCHKKGYKSSSESVLVRRLITVMKLGGNRPPGDNPLLLSISGTGSFTCPVTQTRLDIPKPLITQSWGTGGKLKCWVPQLGLEPTTHRSQSSTLTHWASLPPPQKKKINIEKNIKCEGWGGWSFLPGHYISQRRWKALLFQNRICYIYFNNYARFIWTSVVNEIFISTLPCGHLSISPIFHTTKCLFKKTPPPPTPGILMVAQLVEH